MSEGVNESDVVVRYMQDQRYLMAMGVLLGIDLRTAAPGGEWWRDFLLSSRLIVHPCNRGRQICAEGKVTRSTKETIQADT